jgi:hypothetical protein
LLKKFAQNNGVISRNNQDYDPTLPDTAKRLKKHLMELFGINESIYQSHYKKEREYKIKIEFNDQTYNDKSLNDHFGQTYKNVPVPDVKGLTKGKATGTQANAGRVIEGKDEIENEIEDIFAQAQSFENCARTARKNPPK